MKALEITRLINCVLEGVENSRLGKIEYTQTDGKKVMNHLPYTAFYTVLQALLPKEISGKIGIEEPKEPWQK